MLSVERRCAGKRATCSPASAPPAVGRHGRMAQRAMLPLPGALGTGCDIINKTGEAYSDGSRYTTGGATEAPNQ